ncbi:MAG: nucleoside/nucleotide kinase family protein [Pseudomonadota bacterium]
MSCDEGRGPQARPAKVGSMMTLQALIRLTLGLKPAERVLVAVAGPPASGKSTLAHDLALGLRDAGRSAAVVPMDGFHFDDCILSERGDLARKGAPWTFDVGGFAALVTRLAANADDVIYVPVFDRSLELSRASARAVPADTEVLVVEGNYLLLDDPAWAAAAQHYDMTVMLDVDLETLTQRLHDRWLDFGLSPDLAREKAAENDLPNGTLVVTKSRRADVYLAGTGPKGNQAPR